AIVPSCSPSLLKTLQPCCSRAKSFARSTAASAGGAAPSLGLTVLSGIAAPRCAAPCAAALAVRLLVSALLATGLRSSCCCVIVRSDPAARRVPRARRPTLPSLGGASEARVQHPGYFACAAEARRRAWERTAASKSRCYAADLHA